MQLLAGADTHTFAFKQKTGESEICAPTDTACSCSATSPSLARATFAIPLPPPSRRASSMRGPCALSRNPDQPPPTHPRTCAGPVAGHSRRPLVQSSSYPRFAQRYSVVTMTREHPTPQSAGTPFTNPSLPASASRITQSFTPPFQSLILPPVILTTTTLTSSSSI